VQRSLVNNTVEGSTNLIDHTNPNAIGATEAAIHTEDGHELRLRFRTSDLYLVGWYDSTDRYRYIGPATEARIPGDYVSNAQQLVAGADYGALEREGGFDRTTMVFSRIATEADAMSLWKSTNERR
jgi:hypothetical protein